MLCINYTYPYLMSPLYYTEQCSVTLMQMTVLCMVSVKGTLLHSAVAKKKISFILFSIFLFSEKNLSFSNSTEMHLYGGQILDRHKFLINLEYAHATGGGQQETKGRQIDSSFTDLAKKKKVQNFQKHIEKGICSKGC